MNVMMSRGARYLVLVSCVAAVSACGLPRSGPNKREIFSSSVLQQGDAFVVSVNDRVTRATSVVPELSFPKSFASAGRVTADTISA